MSNSATDANPPPPQDNTSDKQRKSLSIIELPGNVEARLFFLESKSYFDLDIPSYINFSKMLDEVSKLLKGNTDIKEYRCKDNEIGPQGIEAEEINHVVVTNKDGGLTWRPMSLIHPVLYVLLVNLITTERNWKRLTILFRKFSKIANTECHSLPRKSYEEDSSTSANPVNSANNTLVTDSSSEERLSTSTNPNRAQLVSHWWEHVEQRALELALEYSFVIHADIANCYGSIYTHSIPWAIHGKEEAKNSKNNKELLGNKIDELIRAMSYGQTNGIPQGSSLMDFIAEIVLGCIDEELANKISEKGISSYRILRYRDDYRVFTNNPKHGKIILQCLSETLRSVGMRLNDSKTKQSNDTISASIKPDKLAWLCRGEQLSWLHEHENKGKDEDEDKGKDEDGNKDKNKNEKLKKISVQKKLLTIYTFSLDYPNSGTLLRALTDFLRKDLAEALENKGKSKLDDRKLTVLISIIVTLAHNNPRVLPPAAAILSHLLGALPNETVRTSTMEKIERRLKESPNTGQLELWLQRIRLKQDITESKPEYSKPEYKEPLCNILTTDIALFELYKEQETIEQEAEDKSVPNKALTKTLRPVRGNIKGLERSRKDLFDILWDSSWMKPDITNKLCRCTIFDQDEYDSLETFISSEEVAFFPGY